MTGLEPFLQGLGAKRTSKADEWLMDCWVCEARKLYFNVAKVKGFCVKCWEPRSLEDIANRSGIDRRQVYQYIQDAKLADMRAYGLKETMLQGLMGRTRAMVTELPEIAWPEEYRSLRDGKDSINGKQALRYMFSRGFDIEMLYNLNFGYCATGFYAQRIIIPFYEDGRLIYWQARDYSGNADPKKKILNPPNWLVTTGKTQVLFNIDSIKRFDVGILTESWGSALAVGNMAFAINGWHMSDRQLDLIKESPVTTVIVLLDPGQEMASWDTAKRLSTWKRVYVADLKDGDPNEVQRHVLYKTLSEAKLYTSSDYLKQVARLRLPVPRE